MSIDLYTREQVLEDTKKIQYLYRLKREIRYNMTREEAIVTESVAEHIYGMHIISQYFLNLEDPHHTLSRQKVYELITWHDIGEVKSGDLVSWVKTDADKVREAQELQEVIETLPKVIHEEVRLICNEYENQASAEAQFVKGLDKIEPLFEMYSDHGVAISRRNKKKKDAHLRVKHPYIESYPFMRRFCDVLTEELDRLGAFGA